MQFDGRMLNKKLFIYFFYVGSALLFFVFSLTELIKDFERHKICRVQFTYYCLVGFIYFNFAMYTASCKCFLKEPTRDDVRLKLEKKREQ